MSITRDAWETAQMFPAILRPLVFVSVWPIAALWHWLDAREAARAARERQIAQGAPASDLPAPDEYGYWTRSSEGGLHFHAYDPAFEDED